MIADVRLCSKYASALILIFSPDKNLLNCKATKPFVFRSSPFIESLEIVVLPLSCVEISNHKYIQN